MQGIPMIGRNNFLRIVFLNISLFSSVTASAGLFDDATNLKVLPEDITAEELRATMRGISMGTGNRCSACHVGEVEADLSTYDFSLDDKANKLKARKMIKMTKEINASLARAFPEAGESIVAVTCATCHRGQSKPLMIEDILQASVAADGLDESIARYRELRERYYGGYTYDFSERMLMRVAETFGTSNKLDAALAYATLNLEYYPESSRTYLLRGQILAEQGQIDAARKDMQKALEIEPQSQWIRQQLDNLK